MEYAHRALTTWPHASTPSHKRRSRWTFKAPWSDTVWKLGYEIERLSGHRVVVASQHAPSDIRQDGMLRSNARVPVHPGVEISFEVPAGADPKAQRGRQLVRQFGGVKGALRATHPDTRDPTAGLTDYDFAAVLASQESGRMVLATDAYEDWQHNIRAIALTLEALRAVDRYGATQGRQYAGFAGTLTAKAGA